MSSLIGLGVGQYHILEEIGRGGMATIYRAEQASVGREVAIKFLHLDLVEQDRGFLDRFHREVQIVAHLQHPHILPVYDFGDYNGRPYIVMPYLSSGTLADHLYQRGQMRLAESTRLVRQVADALDYAHAQGVIHRDIKPSNVLLDEPGNAYLADFGLAKTLQSPHITASGVVGTPDYLAPDWAAEPGLSTSSDIYALGVMLYQMLTGEVPFRATTPMGVLMTHVNTPVPDVRDKCRDLPDAVQSVIATGMAKSATERYPSAGDLAAALEAAGAGAQPTFSPHPPSSDTSEAFFFPAAYMRANLLAAQDVLGEQEFHGVLLLAGLEDLIDNSPPDDIKQAFPVERFSRLWHGIYELYGIRGLRSIGRLAGQRVQVYSAASPSNAVLRAAARTVLKALPLKARVRIGLRTLSRYFPDQGIEIEEYAKHWAWRVHRCPNCWRWTAEHPVCYSWIGYLQAEMAWATEGLKFRIIETECRAKGDNACVFLMDKKPLEADK